MLNKIRDFCLKYKLIFAMAATSILLFLNLIDNGLEWLSISFIILFAFSMNVQEAFCYSMFLSAFSRVGLNFIVGMVACSVSILGRYIFDLVKKRKKAYELPLIMTFAIILIYTFIGMNFEPDGLIEGFLIIYMLGITYFAFVYSKEINVSRCFNSILIGFIVAAAIGFGASELFNAPIDMFVFDGKDHRLQLLSYQMNNITVHAVMQIAYAICSLFNRKRKIWNDIVAILTFVVLGALTLSKAFLLTLVILAVVFVVLMIIKLKKKAILPALVTVAVCVIGAVVCWSYIETVIERLFVTHTDGSLISMITTGRTDSWLHYLEYWGRRTRTIFFGEGLFYPPYDLKGTHNVALYILYRFGVVGLFMVAGLVMAYAKSSERKIKLNLSNWLVLAAWLLLSLEEVVLSDQFAIYLLLGIILLLQESCQTQNKSVKIKKTEEETKALETEMVQESTEAKTAKTSSKKIAKNKLTKTQNKI